MPYQATVIPVMIATPGDVADEREIIRDAIHEWNDVNSAATNIVLLAVGWDTHAVPELGHRPQQLINDRVLKDCDLLIGVFWTRLGSKTGRAASGTVEEINEHEKVGKPAMIYFSSKPVAPESLDPEQYARLQSFKSECQSRGLFETFDAAEEFRGKVSKQLQMMLFQNEYLKSIVAAGARDRSTKLGITAGTAVPAAPGYRISGDASTLLKAAAIPKMGMIVKIMNLSGTIVQAGGQSFGKEDPRESARWQAALAELVKEKLVEARGYKGEMFELTHLGWTTADKLS